MSPPAKNGVFYLGFDEATGDFVDVVPPEGKEKHLKVHPKIYNQYKRNEPIVGVSKKDLEAHIESVEKRKKTSKIREEEVVFVHGSGICGGSVGGIPFTWCP